MEFPKIKHRRALASANSYLQSSSKKERKDSYESFMRLMVTGSHKKEKASIALIDYELEPVRKKQYRDLLIKVILKYGRENLKSRAPKEFRKILVFLFDFKSEDSLKILKKCLSTKVSLDDKLIWMKLLINEFNFFNDVEAFKALTVKNKKEILARYRKVIARVKKTNALSRIEIITVTVAPKGKRAVLWLSVKGASRDNTIQEVRLPPYLSEQLINFFDMSNSGFIHGVLPFHKMTSSLNDEEDKFRKRMSTELSDLRKRDEVLKRIPNLRGEKVKLEDKVFDLFIIEKNERKNSKISQNETIDLIYLNWEITSSLTKKTLKDWRSKVSGK